MADRAAPKTIRLPREKRRAQLVDAAAAAFLTRGFDGTSMEDVARQAGVTRLIVYRIFESKEALYTAVLTSATDEMLREFGDVDVARDVNAAGLVDGLLRVARRRPDAFRLLWRHAAHEPDFVAFSTVFRSAIDGYANALLARFVDEQYRSWAAYTATAYVFEGICAWLDVGRDADDQGFSERHTAGVRALVAAWSSSR